MQFLQKQQIYTATLTHNIIIIIIIIIYFVKQVSIYKGSEIYTDVDLQVKN